MTSMSQPTFNVLLSFAQLQREITAERIRYKIAASNKKGMWMGGSAPLGYDTHDKQLVVNKTEAAAVKDDKSAAETVVNVPGRVVQAVQAVGKDSSKPEARRRGVRAALTRRTLPGVSGTGPAGSSPG